MESKFLLVAKQKTAEWPPSKSLKIKNTGEAVYKREPTLLMEMQIGVAPMDNSIEIPQKTK